MQSGIGFRETVMATQLQPPSAAPQAPLEIMDVDDLATYLKVQKSTIYERLRWRSAGESHPLPAHKMGGYWRFLKHEIDAWLVSLPPTNRTRKRKYLRKQVAAGACSTAIRKPLGLRSGIGEKNGRTRTISI